jgi:hypothetical protein
MLLRGTLLSLPQKRSKGGWHRGPQPTWVVTMILPLLYLVLLQEPSGPCYKRPQTQGSVHNMLRSSKNVMSHTKTSLRVAHTLYRSVTNAPGESRPIPQTAGDW